MGTKTRPSGTKTGQASAGAGRGAAAGLAGLAGLHVAWGMGSSVPFATREDLADAVIGQSEVPPPAACYAVAGALLVAAGLAVDAPFGPPGLRQAGRWGVAGVLGLRGAIGLSGRTDVISPGSLSPRFRQLDRAIYSPLCLSLALATALANRDSPVSLR